MRNGKSAVLWGNLQIRGEWEKIEFSKLFSKNELLDNKLGKEASKDQLISIFLLTQHKRRVDATDNYTA